MDLILLIGCLVIFVAGYLVWKHRPAKLAAPQPAAQLRRREDARDWQRRFGPDSPLAANFLQPTQNEILETLYALDHLMPSWELGDAASTERSFMNELASSFPTLRKAQCAFPLPFAETPLAIGRSDRAGAQNPDNLRAREERIAAQREAFRLNRAQTNALEQIVTGAGGLVGFTPGGLPTGVAEAKLHRRARNPWFVPLAGSAMLIVVVLDAIQFSPAFVRLASTSHPSARTLALVSPQPAPVSTEPSPTIPVATEPIVAATPTPATAPVVVVAAGPTGSQAPSVSASAKAALEEQIAASKQRAVQKYPSLAVEGSEINLRFVFRYKNLVQQNSPRLLEPTWPEQLVEECAVASGMPPKRNNFTQVLGTQR